MSRMPLDADYLVGPGGARIVWPDGRAVSLPSRAVIRLEGQPRIIRGKLYRMHPDGSLSYEAPTLKAESTDDRNTAPTRPGSGSAA